MHEADAGRETPTRVRRNMKKVIRVAGGRIPVAIRGLDALATKEEVLECSRVRRDVKNEY